MAELNSALKDRCAARRCLSQTLGHQERCALPSLGSALLYLAGQQTAWYCLAAILRSLGKKLCINHPGASPT